MIGALVLASQLSDFSASLNAALTTGDATTPAYDFQASNLVVPAGHHLHSGGGTMHVPASASWGVKLAGPGASVDNLTVVGLRTNGNGFVMTPGTRATFCTAQGFRDGFYSSGAVATSPWGESYVRDCHAINCTYAGIEWQGPSDSFIGGFVAENTASGENGAPYGQYGILVAAGGAGYVSDCHSWGSWGISASIQASQCLVTGLTAEGGRSGLLRLSGTGIVVRDAYLFGPVGSHVTALILGTTTVPASGCTVDARFGTGAFAAILGHVNDQAGNSYALSGTTQPINLGPKDVAVASTQ